MAENRRLEIHSRVEKGLERRFQKLLRDCVAAAIDAGANPADVNIYYESEGSLHICSGNTHPGLSACADQSVVMGSLRIPRGVNIDCGSW